MALATRPQPSAYHKKRHAQHHRHSKPYLKTYWPYLPMLMIVGVGLVINSVWSASNVLGVKSDFSSTALLSSTNTDRLNNHETVLSINPQLQAAAQAKANDMVRYNYWSHNSPNGKTPWAFITSSGYQYQAAGENLAYGFSGASDTVAGWMNSKDHRANILDANYQNVGFGVASSPDYQGKGPETVVVAEYAQPVGSATGTLSVAGSGSSDLQSATAEPVARIQLLTGGQAEWSALAVSALAGGALALLIIRHGLRLRRLVVEGETFVANHPMLDIAITFVVTAGFVLTRTSGLIR